MKASLRDILLHIYSILYKFYGPQGWWPGDTRLEVIVGAILTQNTSWKSVEKAISNLKKAKILSRPSLIDGLSRKKLAGLIKPSGYYNVKAKRLKNFIRFLSSSYGSSLNRVARQNTDRLREEFLNVNGIGPETCDSILLYAFNRPVFVVDAYTRRVFSRHGLFSGTTGYDEIQKIFMDNLPRDKGLFNEYHALIVRLAKEICKTRPGCAACPLKGYNQFCTQNWLANDI